MALSVFNTSDSQRVLSTTLAVACSAMAMAMALALAAAPARAQYPVKPVRVVVPLAPGGGSDIVARIVAQALSERWGQSVVVDNRPGAGGTLGNNIVARAAADGYTLLISSTTLAIAPAMYKNTEADAVRQLAAVSLLADQPSLLAVNAQLPVKSLQELLSLMKAQPGKYAFGSAGQGTASHLANELFTASAGVQGTHIPYKSAGLAATALLAGEVQFMVTNMATALPQMRAGRLKGLGVTSLKRVAVAPELPTLNEAGLAGFEYTTWYGMLAPTRTREAVITRLHTELAHMARDVEVLGRLRSQGLDARLTTPAVFARHLEAEIAKWERVVHAARLAAH